MDGMGQVNVSELLKVDPLQFVNEGFQEQIGLLDNKAAELHANLTRDSDNSLRMLNNEYKIRADAMRRQWESIPENQRDDALYDRADKEWNNLVTNYQIQVNKIQGKVEPDLKDWEANYNLQKQQLEMARNEKIRHIREIQQLRNENVITDDANMQAKIYSIATGMNFSPSSFKQPDPIQEAIRLGLAAVELNKQGRYEEADAAKSRQQQLFGEIDPNQAKAIENATRFSGAEGRRKARETRKERAGTIAEGITQAKNANQKIRPLMSSGLEPFGEFMLKRGLEEVDRTKPTETKQAGPEPIYQKNRATGQTRVSYNGGKTWQVIG